MCSISLFPSSLHPLKFCLIFLLALNAACSSKSSDKQDEVDPSQLDVYKQENPWVEASYPEAAEYYQKCESPREGADPITGEPYLHTQGTLYDELFFIRSMFSESYLWNDELADLNPYNFADRQSYFYALRALDDEFSNMGIYEPVVNELANGVVYGYGIKWDVRDPSLDPYPFVVGFVEKDSPNFGLVERGDRVSSANGISWGPTLTESERTRFFNLLDGLTDDDAVEFEFIKPSGDLITVTIQKTEVNLDSVPTYSVLPNSDNSTVGYLLFNTHVESSTDYLVDAVNYFIENDIDDLVLDLRFNTGGLLSVASQLSYMIAGDDKTEGLEFEYREFNDQLQTAFEGDGPNGEQRSVDIPFFTTKLDSNGQSVGEVLPTLNLDRVAVITSWMYTCSASESIINTLKGLGVEVIQVGTETCGKPFGYLGVIENCGYAYNIINFKGQNALGFGDYDNGFRVNNSPDRGLDENPGCEIADEYTGDFGDLEENMLASALDYLANGQCGDDIASSPPQSFKSQLQMFNMQDKRSLGAMLRSQ